MQEESLGNFIPSVRALTCLRKGRLNCSDDGGSLQQLKDVVFPFLSRRLELLPLRDAVSVPGRDERGTVRQWKSPVATASVA